jgi:cobalamin biosynthesis Mg chelatase CobN
MAVRGRRGVIALTCAAALAVPAAALANAYDDTLREYRSTGAVDGCKHTAEELSQAKDQTPKNIADIAPGYPAQLALAAAKRAKGCSASEETSTSSSTAAAPAGTTDTGAGAGAGATTQAPAGTDPGATTQPPATTTIAPNAPQTAATTAPAPAATQAAAQPGSSHKGARLALLVLAALVLILLALWAAARWWAWEPHWLVRWRHATAEAGWRASAAWAEFTDWLRLGR